MRRPPIPKATAISRPTLTILLLGTLLPSIALTALPAFSAEASGAPWTQWRGPERNGAVTGADWPDSLDGLEPLWRVELGKGYPGPIVYGDKVFVAETFDDDTERVRALDRANGRELWSASWSASGSVPFFAAKNGDWIRSTPAHDGQALYVGGMEEVLVKLDSETGEEIWRVDFPARFDTGVPDFGFASSPVIDGDALYVQAANSVVKLDAASGETIWRALESSGDMMNSGAFSSPLLATLSGRPQLLVQTRYTLHGVDPASGEVLWSQEVPNFRGMNILTPVVHEDRVLTSTHRNRTYLYEVSSDGGGLASRERWSNKVQGYMSTPVVIDGHAYLHLGNGRMACLDLDSGEERWISEPFGDYWSLVTQGDKILALDESGELHLLRANPERMELLGSREIADQPTWGHLAISGDQIFVRELKAIAAYRWSRPTSGAATATSP
jgi:outer membrane protein assembly factor BamB